MLTRREIRNNAHAFVNEWLHETREHAEAKSFWGDFFEVFGVNRRRVASFEEPVRKAARQTGFIDLLWKGKLLIEHKSKGKDLNKAYTQALNYFQGLKDEELPRYVLVSDFHHFRLYDLDSQQDFAFTLPELPEHVHLFDFIAGYENPEKVIDEIDLNLRAAERLGALHDALRAADYIGHALEVFLVRILFCLFAEDTSLFARHQFILYLLKFTREDGSDTDMHLDKLFKVLDSEVNKRSRNLPEELAAFPYVNGHLFAERFDLPSFDEAMRDLLIECAFFNWAGISPAIFGSLFQSVLEPKTRRNLGAHYTSEKHILRVIEPLFLDGLKAELSKINAYKEGFSERKRRLQEFQQKLSALQFLDPACGCGNFLIITYRELRRLELELLQAQHGTGPGNYSPLDIEPLIRLEHFHGIELEEWPARIAEVAMWLTQHQMNREFARQFGREPDLLPLKDAAHIVNDNALRLDWAEVVAPGQLDYLIGNPPFVGKNFRNPQQNADMDALFVKVNNYKSLDFVACWFVKAASFLKKAVEAGGNPARAALVATNSITMGEQVAPLWQPLLALGVDILFAHRTFAWESEAKGKAAVHVVIIGFEVNKNAQDEKVNKRLFYYHDIKGEPEAVKVNKISPYLIDAPPVIIEPRYKPICNVPIMTRGSQPTDGGNLLLTYEEYQELIKTEPQSKEWIKPFLMGEDYINGTQRYCLWLKKCNPEYLRKMPKVMKRVEAVKRMRNASVKEQTRMWANNPSCFTEDRQPDTAYLAIPRVSSINRSYIPIGYLTEDHIAGDKLQIIPNTELYHYGILSSHMHMTWVKVVGGRLKSDFSYSNTIVYNNFPWPEADEKTRQAVETAAQAVLDARARHPGSTLADLYDPITMPVDLRKAHRQLDAAVDRAYRKAAFKDDNERLGLLFERYRQLVSQA